MLFCLLWIIHLFADIIPQLSLKLRLHVNTMLLFLDMQTPEKGQYKRFNYCTTVCEPSCQKVKNHPHFIMNQPLMFRDTLGFHLSVWPLKNDFQLLFWNSPAENCWQWAVDFLNCHQTRFCLNYIEVEVERITWAKETQNFLNGYLNICPSWVNGTGFICTLHHT